MKFLHRGHLFRLAIMWLFWISCAVAEDAIVLFQSPGVPVANYNQLVWRLKPRDRIKFSNGREFEVKQILGKGLTTLVIETSERRALRIPLRSGVFHRDDEVFGGFRDHVTFGQILDSFYRGDEDIRKLKLNSPRIHDWLSSEFILVQKINKRFSLREFLSGDAEMSAEERDRALLELKKWVRKLWPVSSIGDFHEDQVLFDGSRWRLVDYSSKTHWVEDYLKGITISNIPEVVLEDPVFSLSTWQYVFRDSTAYSHSKLEKLFEDLTQIIISERKRRMMPLLNRIRARNKKAGMVCPSKFGKLQNG